MPSEEYIRKEYIQEGAVLRRIDAEYLIDLEERSTLSRLFIFFYFILVLFPLILRLILSLT